MSTLMRLAAVGLVLATPASMAEVDRKETNYLPPAFVAEKFGVHVGDRVKKDTAMNIAEEAKNLGEKMPSFFKVAEDEVLMLPEVFSNLKAEDLQRDFAEENDTAGAERLRESRWWGRLYIDGWPQSVQYLRAHFGTAPPKGVRRFVVASPLDACDGLTNTEEMKDAIVLTTRGNCTFGHKAKAIEAAGGAAMVLVNNEPGNHHIPAPDAHDLPMSASMIQQQEGGLLINTIQRGQSLTGAMVPVHCIAKSEVNKESDLCQPSTPDDKKIVKAMMEGGWFTTPSGDRHEFLIANFGTRVPSTPVSVVAADPQLACGELRNGNAIRGKAVVIPRGKCQFIEKAEYGKHADASMVIIANTETTISRLGVEPRWRGLDIDVPVVMVTDKGGEALLALGADETVTFSLSTSVSKATWEKIEGFRTGEAWSRKEEHAEQEKSILLDQSAGWPERQEAVEQGWELYLMSPRRSKKANSGEL